MERIKALVRKIFGFSRTETNAFIILLPLMVVILFSEPIYRQWVQGQPPDFSSDQQKLDSLVSQLRWLEADSFIIKKSFSAVIKFKSFDPNFVSENEFEQLGLSPSIAKRLVHFREKGGFFRKKEDLLKIYGMDSTWYNLANPWMIIAPKAPKPKALIIDKRSKIVEMVDLNEADSLALIKVYGVGPALSKRIRAFRSRLGGFVSMEQLREVYGLDTTVVNEIKKRFYIALDFQPIQINLNTSDLEGLMKHPYIRRNEGKAILSYRMQHGNFTSIDELQNIQVLSPDWVEKIRPYIVVN